MPVDRTLRGRWRPDDLFGFLTQFFPTGSRVELRAIRSEPARVSRSYHLTTLENRALLENDERLVRWIDDHTVEPWGLYFGPNPRSGASGDGASCLDSDVPYSNSVFADFDNTPREEVRARLRTAFVGAAIPSPTLLISSGHDLGTHTYWMFAEREHDLPRWANFQRAIIQRFGSDRTIVNPSRVMRLPGSFNWKRGGFCEVLELGLPLEFIDGINLAPVESLPRQGNALAGHTREGNRNPVDRENLSRQTLAYFMFGAGEGERNSRLFSAACDMLGCGYPEPEIRERLSRIAITGGLSPNEIEATLRSALGRPRDAARPDREIIPDLVNNTPETSTPPPTTTPDQPPPFVPENTTQTGTLAETLAPAADPPRVSRPRTSDDDRLTRLTLSNVDVTWVMEGQRRKRVKAYKDAPQVAREVSEALGSWPRRLSSGALFAIKRESDTPGAAPSTWFLSKPADLFAMLHERGNVHWLSGECEERGTGDSMTALTKDEFFAYLRDNASPVYESISDLPHFPERANIYYIPRELPPPTGEKLTTLLDAFNPETALDRDLMLAALLTPGWGGPPGTRPAFVFTSDHGQGVGKTETAKAIGNVWGGAAMLDYEDDWSSLMKSLMSSGSWASRVILFDNVRGRFSGTAIESALTSATLSGHRMYVGTIRRPNDACFFVTFNMPEMSRDLAQRSVVVKLGASRWQANFAEWSMGFIEENRLQLVSDLLAILRGPDRCAIRSANADRWRAWQSGVLTKIATGDALARLIIDRRPGVEGDAEDASEIVEALSEYLQRTDRGEGVAEITAAEIYAELTRVGAWRSAETDNVRVSARKCMNYVRSRLLGRGVLTPCRSASGEGGEAGENVRRARVDEQGRFTTNGRRFSTVYLWNHGVAHGVAPLDFRGTPPVGDDLPI